MITKEDKPCRNLGLLGKLAAVIVTGAVSLPAGFLLGVGHTENRTNENLAYNQGYSQGREDDEKQVRQNVLDEAVFHVQWASDCLRLDNGNDAYKDIKAPTREDVKNHSQAYVDFIKTVKASENKEAQEQLNEARTIYLLQGNLWSSGLRK